MARFVTASLILLLLSAAPEAMARGPEAAPGRWIVQLRPGADVAAVVRTARTQFGTRPTHVFSRALRGFATALTPAQRARLLADPRVLAIVADRPVQAVGDPPQQTPSGIRRVGALENPDRGTGTLPVDIAVIDTGIDPTHPDLNVRGGYNCTKPAQTEAEREQPSAWRDGTSFGHGTHVAGTAAALDNAEGVVGVAPGARLWAIKVLDGAGNGYWSWVVCGLERVAAMRDPDNPALPRIEVANMSLAGGGWDDGNCGYTNNDLLHQAVCNLHRAGVTIVVAAGNDATNAAKFVPGAYDEVITVSAMADWDGQPGGSGTPPVGCTDTDIDDDDDAFASFSSYGPDVDLIAPGACVRSTFPLAHASGGYGLMSGTSMATPHVAGGAALYHLWEAREGRPRPSPAQVRAALIAKGTLDWRTTTDPDRSTAGSAREPALRVADFDLAAGFRIGTTPQLLSRRPGQSAIVDVWLARLGGFAGPIELSVTESTLPAGVLASFQPETFSAPSSGWARLSIDLPAKALLGTHDVEIVAAAGELQRTTTFRLFVAGAGPADPGSPLLNLLSGVQAGSVALPARARWTAVKGADRYELQVSRDGAPWALVDRTTATRREVKVWPGSFYQYRVRARKNGVWGGWLTGSASLPTPYYAPSDGVVLSGTWSVAAVKRSYSELPVYSTQAGARATLDFTGRSVAWISTRGPNRGRARVFIDGTHVATIDLYASSKQHRRVVFSKWWTSQGDHRIRIEVVGTPSRPRVDVDAVTVVSIN